MTTTTTLVHSAATPTMPAATSAANKQQKEKRIIALKYSDGHPLTRQDLQYDLLHHIFSDPRRIFTNPYPTNPGQALQPKITFKDLYLNTILSSPKCSRGPRDKALENPDFGTEFAKISLLTNVGRINTTMACQSYTPRVPKRALLIPFLPFSLPGTPDTTTDLSSRPATPEDRWKPPRCPEDKEHPQRLFPVFGGQRCTVSQSDRDSFPSGTCSHVSAPLPHLRTPRSPPFYPPRTKVNHRQQLL